MALGLGNIVTLDDGRVRIDVGLVYRVGFKRTDQSNNEVRLPAYIVYPFARGLVNSILLGIVFVILRLTGSIDWSWVWVTAAFWITAALWLLGGFGYVMGQMFDSKKKKSA